MISDRVKFWNFYRTTDALRQAALGAVLVGIYSVLPVIIEEKTVIHEFADHSALVYAGAEVLVGLLLVLRANAAYARWWEARILWGKLVNVSRNLVVKAQSLVELSKEDELQIKEHVATFATELRDHLRVPKGSASEVASGDHRPVNRVREIYRLLNSWRIRGLISDDVLRVLDSEAREFLEVCGGCERILKTPLPTSYRVFVRQCIFFILLSLPWSLANEIGRWAVPITMLIAYFFIGMELVARTIEEPFGTKTDDLELDDICRTIERTT